MDNAVETHVENVFIELFRARPELAGFQFNHRDNDGTKGIDAIAIGATAAARQLEGPMGDSIEVTCQFTGTTTDAQRNDMVAAAMRSAIMAPATADAIDAFSSFWIFAEEMTGERSEEEDSRTRTITVPVLCRLA